MKKRQIQLHPSNHATDNSAEHFPSGLQPQQAPQIDKNSSANVSHTIASRKEQHVNLCVDNRVSFRAKTAGFERIDFVHCALPECNFNEVSTEASLLGRVFSMPLLISSMTGGYTHAERINRELAEVCFQWNLPMGLGSQRQVLEREEFHHTFRAARAVSSSLFLCSNIGATEVAKISTRSRIHEIIDLIEADALIIHLNPLQELLQPEGETQFSGVLDGIETLAKTFPDVPLIAKEVGAGISKRVAEQLINAGVRVIDVAGAGGTSWAGVELLRNPHAQSTMSELWDWGIPTVESIIACAELRRKISSEKLPHEPTSFEIIASGGISNGFEIAKSLALGADFAASARPLLETLLADGQQKLSEKIGLWKYQLQSVQFLTGSPTISTLQHTEIRFR